MSVGHHDQDDARMLALEPSSSSTKCKPCQIMSKVISSARERASELGMAGYSPIRLMSGSTGGSTPRGSSSFDESDDASHFYFVRLMDARGLARDDHVDGGSFVFVEVLANLPKGKPKLLLTSEMVPACQDPQWDDSYMLEAPSKTVSLEVVVCSTTSIKNEDDKKSVYGKVLISKDEVMEIEHKEFTSVPHVWHVLAKRCMICKGRGDIRLALARSSHSSMATKLGGDFTELASTALVAVVTAAPPGAAAARILPSLSRIVSGTVSDMNSTSTSDDVISMFFKEEEYVFEDPMPMPNALHDAILMEGVYKVSVVKLNRLLFGENSEFWTAFNEKQKITDFVQGPWQKEEDQFQRQVSYVHPATTMLKAYNVSETQTYQALGGGGFQVATVTSTPSVPYGTKFRVQMQYDLLPVSQDTCQLRISFQIEDFGLGMFKVAVANGTKNGLKANFVDFAQVLSNFAPPVLAKMGLNPFTLDDPSLIRRRHLYNLTQRVLTVAVLVAFFIHLALLNSAGGSRKGLEIIPLIDIPDSIMELLYAVLWMHAAKHLFKCMFGDQMFRIYFSDWLKLKVETTDHRRKGKGSGWIINVMVVEARGLPAGDSTGFSDPFVVLKCDGQARSTSHKIQTLEPFWAELLEFDAMGELPSKMEVEIYNYNLFTQPDLLGVAEVNLVQHESVLTDIWMQLIREDGSNAGQLHLRFSIRNTRPWILQNGSSGVRPMNGRKCSVSKELSKGGIDIGRMFSKAPAHKRDKSAQRDFIQHFSMPESEELIDHFMCATKGRAVGQLIQGHVYLTQRTIAFKSSIIGIKKKFHVLWSDVDELKVNSKSINVILRVLNPSVTLYLRKGALPAELAKKTAYGEDPDGRAKIRFQSFLNPSEAIKLFMDSWRHFKPAIVGESGAAPMLQYSTQSDSTGLTKTIKKSAEINCSMHAIRTRAMEEDFHALLAEKLGWTQSRKGEWSHHIGQGVQEREYTFMVRFMHDGAVRTHMVICLVRAVFKSNKTYIDETWTLPEMCSSRDLHISVHREMRDAGVKKTKATMECNIVCGNYDIYHEMAPIFGQLLVDHFETLLTTLNST